jgi:hypothetical protein
VPLNVRWSTLRQVVEPIQESQDNSYAPRSWGTGTLMHTGKMLKDELMHTRNSNTTVYKLHRILTAASLAYLPITYCLLPPFTSYLLPSHCRITFLFPLAVMQDNVRRTLFDFDRATETHTYAHTHTHTYTHIHTRTCTYIHTHSYTPHFQSL